MHAGIRLKLALGRELGTVEGDSMHRCRLSVEGRQVIGLVMAQAQIDCRIPLSTGQAHAQLKFRAKE